MHILQEKATIGTTYIFGAKGGGGDSVHFLINPAAGKADATADLLPRIHAAAARAGVQPVVQITQYAGHARELAAACAAQAEPAYLYACGGDGTLNEVIQGAAGHDHIAVGCIPCGSGNDYVRNFGTQQNFLDLDAQLAACALPVDLIRTPQGYGIEIYAAGIDAQVANGIAKWRRVPLCGGTTPIRFRFWRRCAARSAIPCASGPKILRRKART